jgi:heme/copper-type cytochrome/quinol oxidase subunit 3
MQAQTFMLTFFIFISPHSFHVTPGEKIPQVSVFCGFVGTKQETFRQS